MVVNSEGLKILHFSTQKSAAWQPFSSIEPWHMIVFLSQLTGHLGGQNDPFFPTRVPLIHVPNVGQFLALSKPGQNISPGSQVGWHMAGHGRNPVKSILLLDIHTPLCSQPLSSVVPGQNVSWNIHLG